MIKRFIQILVLLLLISITSGATGSAYNWESANLTVVESVESGDLTTLTLRDKDQRLFKVTYSGKDLPDDVARTIVKYKTEFFSWRNLEIKEIRFVLSLDILEIVIIPTRIIYNGVNMVDAVPAGMVFVFDPASSGNELYYDFKILKDNLIVRVTGKYTTETELNKNLFRAYDNPKAYLSSMGRVTEPTKLVEPTPTPTGRPFGTITGKPTGKPSGKPTVTPTGTPFRNITLIGPETTPSPTPTGSMGATLTNADFEFLLDKIIQLQVENERLRYALLVLQNRGFFDEVRPIPQEVILHVLQLKRQYPTLTFDELFSQLKKDGVKITKQELYLILGVYFNEFNDQYL